MDNAPSQPNSSTVDHVQPSLATDALISSSIQALNLVQRASAVTFSTFIVVHLSSPVAGIVRGEAGASSWLLLGREWYRGRIRETIFVFGALGLHVISGICGRAVKNVDRKRRVRRNKGVASSAAVGEDEMVADPAPVHLDQVTTFIPATPSHPYSSSPSPPFSFSLSRLLPSTLTLHHLAGYVLLPLVTHHIYLHRLIPLHTPPRGSGGVEISYAYTSFATSSGPAWRRATMALGYVSVTSLALWHGLVGWRLLLDPTAPKSLKPRRRRRRATDKDKDQEDVDHRDGQGLLVGRSWQVAYVAAVSSVGVGVARIVTTSGVPPKWLHVGWENVLRRGWAQRALVR